LTFSAICHGDKRAPHSCTILVNVLYGPHFSTLRSRPSTDSSSYVIPMSAFTRTSHVKVNLKSKSVCGTRTSSACTYVSVIGSSSAVGTAVRKLPRASLRRILTQTANALPRENRKLELLLCPRDEAFQIGLADTTDRVHIRYKVRGSDSPGYRLPRAIRRAKI
jgi:hypothetical protein